MAEDTLPLELELLERIRTRLESPSAWTKRAYARNLLGEIVCTDNSDAVCFCVSGASYVEAGVVARERGLPTYFVEDAVRGDAMRRLLVAIYGPNYAWHNVPHWNDRSETTHSDVLAALDGAIATARAELTGGVNEAQV